MPVYLYTIGVRIHLFVRTCLLFATSSSGIVLFTLRSNDRVDAMSDLENTNTL